MSKAFTREDDVAHSSPQPALVSPLPPGVRNFLTADGAARLRAELARLAEAERPRLVTTAATDAEARRELAQLDQRIRYLQQSLRTAEIVPLPGAGADRVRFGASVTVRDLQGVESTYRLVGVDEADVSRHDVSWLSPIARALLNARRGERVAFKFPSGATELEIVRIE